MTRPLIFLVIGIVLAVPCGRFFTPGRSAVTSARATPLVPGVRPSPVADAPSQRLGPVRLQDDAARRTATIGALPPHEIAHLPSLEMRENVDFLLAPGALLQQCLDPNTVVTHAAE